LKKYLSILALLSAGLVLGVPSAFAQTDSPAKADKPAAKKATAKKSTKKPAAKKAAEKPSYDSTGSDDDGKEPDIAGSTHTEYQCDLGASVSIYQNKADDKHIALRWEKTLYRMRRVDTTTGADRFETRRYGLIWIGIPAKGILLDAKKGHQLANECKSPEQMAGKVPAPVAPAATTAPAPVAPAPPAAPAAPEAPKDAVKS
jgi:hypothetical protein